MDPCIEDCTLTSIQFNSIYVYSNNCIIDHNEEGEENTEMQYNDHKPGVSSITCDKVNESIQFFLVWDESYMNI